MGAPRKWIKALLGLKKSDRVVSPGEEENSSGSADEIWHQKEHSLEIENGILENELNQDVDIEFENANFQSVLESASSPSTSLQLQNAAQLQQSMREQWMATAAKDASFQLPSDLYGSPSTSLQVQSAAQLQQNMREEWADIDGKDANFQSVPDPTSSPSTSLQVHNAAQPQLNKREELAAINAKDANFQSVPDASSCPSTSISVLNAAPLRHNMREQLAATRIQIAFRVFLQQNGAQIQQNMSEESAAIRIQTVFRGFMARRALCGLKGLVRLQALVRGHAVRRQASIALHCMQALVKVQARARARHAHMALENQTAQQKLLQQLEHEAQVKKIEDGWCDMVGSADEIQAKLLKRKEAAAKREKAKAYALARQWQAGPRQQVTSPGFEPVKSNWGWNWLERWMAVRPWENRIVDINLKEGIKILENESGGGENVPTARLISTEKKSTSNIGKARLGPRLSNHVKTSNEKRATSHFDGCSPPPNELANAQVTPITPVSSRSCKPVLKNSVKEATSRPNIVSRSLSNPKERSTLSDKQGNKRLSLPGVAHGAAEPTRQLSRTAAKSSPAVPKPVTARNKLNSNDVKTSKLSRQISR